MKKHIVALSFLAPFFAIEAQDFSTLQNAFDVYGGGIKTGSAKFNSMAGATGALGGDANSSLTNPAGLGVAISGSISGTVGNINLSNTSTLVGKVESSQNALNLSNINGVLSFPTSGISGWKFVNVGINYSARTINSTVETGKNHALVFSQELSGGNTDNAYFSGHIYDRIGKQSEVNIALAANYDNRIYIGGGINMHNATIDQYDQSRFYLGNSKSSAIYNLQYTPYGETSKGFSANFGAIVKATNQLRFGLALETPTFWDIERVYTYSGLNNSGFVDSENRAETRYMRTPFKTTLSAAFVPNKKLAVNIDYTFGASNFRYREDGDAEVELNKFLDKQAQNFSQVRIGAEYRIKRLRLRGGYAYTGESLKPFGITQYNAQGVAQRLNTNNILQGPRQQVGLGVGFDFSSMFIDIGYQNITQTYNNPFFAYYYWPNTPRTGNATFSGAIFPEWNGMSKVKQSFNNVYVTFGWKF